MMLSLDYGGRYIGVAATDPEGHVPYRHSTIDRKQVDAITVIKDLIIKDNIQKVLVGLPISLEGNRTEQTEVTEQFITQLRGSLDKAVTVETIDETLTSVEAEKRLRFEGGDMKQAHSEAARILLEDYLRSLPLSLPGSTR